METKCECREVPRKIATGERHTGPVAIEMVELDASDELGQTGEYVLRIAKPDDAVSTDTPGGRWWNHPVMRWLEGSMLMAEVEPGVFEAIPRNQADYWPTP